jgi:hypothetical protein
MQSSPPQEEGAVDWSKVELPTKSLTASWIYLGGNFYPQPPGGEEEGIDTPMESAHLVSEESEEAADAQAEPLDEDGGSEDASEECFDEGALPPPPPLQAGSVAPPTAAAAAAAVERAEGGAGASVPSVWGLSLGALAGGAAVAAFALFALLAYERR